MEMRRSGTFCAVNINRMEFFSKCKTCEWVGIIPFALVVALTTARSNEKETINTLLFESVH